MFGFLKHQVAPKGRLTKHALNSNVRFVEIGLCVRIRSEGPFTAHTDVQRNLKIAVTPYTAVTIIHPLLTAASPCIMWVGDGMLYCALSALIEQVRNTTKEVLMSVLVNFVILFILFLSPAMALDRRNVSAGEVVIESMITGLNTPWSIGFLPDGGILLTERGGRLLHIAKDGSVQEIAGLPPIFVKRQGGLFDIVPARDFESSGVVYVTYAAKVSGGGATTLAQARLSKDRTQLQDFLLLYQQSHATTSGIHFGGRVVEAPDGSLFLTVGDRGERDLAQDKDSANGKVIYISADRTETEIWSIGHRNPQGAAIDLSGELLTSEHGPQGGDELNRPEKGLNYG